ncbi:peptide deformylase [Paraglaciecola sp.]|uniref:peptide deformylase n=1 Tax=Paraglaciecola sp. TaxID=1920173 RepID=UPI00273E688B|nr:peptide deformylase [Paraglaciecola sp.]MDP5029706.1 peptide deformylase [Paraglaciecola sp.]
MKIAQIGEAILRTPARKVTTDELGGAELKLFADAMLNSMLEANGIGIAAPQVFDPRAIMIIASRPNVRYPNAPQMDPVLLINPIILKQSENKVWEWEGCLSVPALRGKIERPDWVEIVYQTIDGGEHKARFEGFVARVFLHEYDHLIGLTWLDHIQSNAHIMANEVWLHALEQGAL